MKYCPVEGESFPEHEFVVIDGVEYHNGDGSQHESRPGQGPLPEAAPPVDLPHDDDGD